MIRSVTTKKFTWINIQNPSRKDVGFLKKNFDFHPLVLGELIPVGHRPRVENHDTYLFLTLYYPYYKKKTHEIERRELDIIVNKTHIITSHYESILPLRALFNETTLYEDSRQKYMNETTGHLLFYIISGLLKTINVKLDNIEEDVNHIEKQIFRGHEKEMVFELSHVRRDIIDIYRILAPQGPIFQSLLREGTDFWGEKLEPYFQDIIGGYSDISNTVEEYRETIVSLTQTNESLLSTKTNEIMKILTIIATIAFPLTLFASIFGMNVYVPFSEFKPPFDFLAIMLLMILTGGAMFLFFRKRKLI